MIKSAIKSKVKSVLKMNDNKNKKEAPLVFEGFRYRIVEGKEDEADYVRIVGVEEIQEKMVVPEEIQGYPVKRISGKAFANKEHIKNIVIPDSVRRIGKGAFYNCSSLKKVQLPKFLIAIPEDCFSSCKNLEKVILSSNLSRIEKGGFKDCEKLTSLMHHDRTSTKGKKKNTVKREGFPETLMVIQEEAFANCRNLNHVNIPESTTTLETGAFQNCSRLELVALHEGLEVMGQAVFDGCGALQKVKVPETLNEIGENAFPQETELMCSPGMEGLLKENGYTNFASTDESALKVVSKMIPGQGDDLEAFYNKEELELAAGLYEMKSSEDENLGGPCKLAGGKESKYRVEEEKYVLKEPQTSGQEHQAKLILSGMLFCENLSADAEAAIKEMTAKADLTIAQARDVISWDENVEDNAFVRMRELGADFVVNAYPSNMNSRVADLYHTLHAVNQAQLIHTGLFASCHDKRYVRLEVNGIQIAVVAYSDVEELHAKAKQYNRAGQETLLNGFHEAQVREDMEEARQDGAEFVLACVYWDKKTGESITERQEYCAKVLAEAGADYIFGCNKEGMLPYSILSTEDQQTVPVVYSAGSLVDNRPLDEELAEDQKVEAWTREQILVEVNLSRDEDGNVFIANHGYYPFVGNHTTDRMTVAVDEKAEQGTLEKQLSLEESVLRVKKNVGINDDFKCLAKVDSKAIAIAEGNVSDLQRKYEVQPVDIGKKKHGVGAKIAEEYVRNSETGMYCRGFDQGEREARIFCTGLIEYDFVLENIAKCFGGYEFRKMFKPVSESFAEADFVIGNLSTMMCADYPSICEVTKEDREKGYSNCREEYLGALKDAGFTALAAANPYNAVLGISGVVDTEAAIQKNQMISSGLGYEKNPIVDINGIKVGILSITTDCFHVRNTLTDEAVAKFLNVYDENRVEDEVEDLKERGAEFVLAYVHCGVGDNKLNQKGRSEVAERVAEAGADYVICTIPRVISEYYQFTTSDDRNVPIVTSLGSFIGGKCPAEGFDGAMLQLYVRKTFDGTIEVDDKYLPLKVCKYHNSREIVPVLSYLNDSDDDRDDEDDEEDLNDFKGTERAVAEKLGEGIKRSKKRLIKVADQYTNTLTMEDIYKILKKEPSKKDLEVFGDKYQKPVPCVALRKRYMREGGVAVMYKFGNFGENAPITWDIEECLEAGVSLVIDNEPHDELPCIVVEEPLMDVFALLSKTVRDWYHPVTVGVTGSMGKTTTKELMTCVFETHYQTACGQGNSNAIYQIGQLIQQLEYDDEAYIQEVHGGTQDTASFTSKVISPDICVITNIVKNHMSQIGTIENLIKNKLEITAGMKENGVLILCHDNEYLKDVKPPVRTIRYSVMDETCHYYARNIKDEGAQISFQIVSNESEFDKAGVYDAKLNIRGVHNVSNALAVFATARQAGIPPHKIIAGLSRYRSTGIRQNVFDHGGVKMLLDAYNSNPKALMAMMEVFDQLEPAEDGRKLLVLGMMGEQGDDSPQIHYDTGKAICQYDFDKLFCFGEDAKYLVQAAKECGREAYYFEDRETFNHVICANVRPGDVVVVKGSHSIALDTETMVPIFGNTIRKY